MWGFESSGKRILFFFNRDDSFESEQPLANGVSRACAACCHVCVLPIPRALPVKCVHGSRPDIRDASYTPCCMPRVCRVSDPRD